MGGIQGMLEQSLTQTSTSVGGASDLSKKLSPTTVITGSGSYEHSRGGPPPPLEDGVHDELLTVEMVGGRHLKVCVCVCMCTRARVCVCFLL